MPAPEGRRIILQDWSVVVEELNRACFRVIFLLFISFHAGHRKEKGAFLREPSLELNGDIRMTVLEAAADLMLDMPDQIETLHPLSFFCPTNSHQLRPLPTTSYNMCTSMHITSRLEAIAAATIGFLKRVVFFASL